MTLIMVFNVWIALLSIWAMIREDKLHMAAVLSGVAALNICSVIYNLLPQGVI